MAVLLYLVAPSKHHSLEGREHGRTIPCVDAAGSAFTEYRDYPPRRWPKVRKGRSRSDMILMIASMGTAKIAPGTPHIQYQKIKDRITATGFIVNRFASSSGVMISPSITWMPK